MKSLILIRHAKSSWDLPVSDKDRELIDIGIESIKIVAKKAESILPSPYTIWSSSAKRASQTAHLFCKTLSIDDNVINFKDELYTFDEYDLAQIIKKCPDEIENLIVFGHNGALTDFVNKFGDKLIYNVPTAGLVFVKFEENTWSNIQKGKTIHTIFPKEIT
ncbi:histidine phosphatase family protein [Flavobacterium sp.]|uniref:SixA phosphatase family protein n=1 Tax=Flavobacterium sp. TaxID=239 RepID=UPI00286EB131|nr:histidine phosphatase family protein [Flavobacterium sp.]